MKNKLDQLETPKSWKIEKLWILSQTFLSQFKISSSSANSRIKIVQEADPKADRVFLLEYRTWNETGRIVDGRRRLRRCTRHIHGQLSRYPETEGGGRANSAFPPSLLTVVQQSPHLHIRSSSISPISSLEQLAKASLDFRLTNNFALLVSWKEYRERTRNLLSRLIRKTFLIPCTLYVTTLR